MPSRFESPPIIKASERLVADVEIAVRRFPQYHRYQIGSGLRAKAMAVHRTANRAWMERPEHQEWVDQLVWEIDEVKQHMQVAKLIGAFKSFAEFEVLIQQVETLGKQAGGWRRSLKHPSVQNAGGRRAVPQRDQKLSTCAASAGANP